MQNSEKLLTPAYLQELAQYINNHANIYATGLAKSFQPAQLFEILMRKKRRTVRAVANDFLGETSAYMDDNDLLILFSVSGRSEIMQSIQHTTGKILLVTANPHPACAEKIDRSVVLPYSTCDPEASSVSPVLFDIFVELLVEYL